MDQRKNKFIEAALFHIDSIYTTALRMTDGIQKAKNVVQKTYQKAFESFHDLNRGANVRVWLFKVMIDQNPGFFSDREERIGFDYKTSAKNSLSCKNPGADETLEINVLENLPDEAVIEAVESLPMRLRLTVILADVEQFKFREIAEILECPVNTVKSDFRKGHNVLRNLLFGHVKKNVISSGQCEVKEKGRLAVAV